MITRPVIQYSNKKIANDPNDITYLFRYVHTKSTNNIDGCPLKSVEMFSDIDGTTAHPGLYENPTEVWKVGLLDESLNKEYVFYRRVTAYGGSTSTILGPYKFRVGCLSEWMAMVDITTTSLSVLKDSVSVYPYVIPAVGTTTPNDIKTYCT
jgi:hypothetical protein